MTAAQSYARELVARHVTPHNLSSVFERDKNIIENMVRWLVKSMDAKRQRMIRSTPVVLLPTGNYNAFAISVPRDSTEAVIALELRLTLVVEALMELALWWAIASNSDQDDPVKLRPIAQYFADLYVLPLLDHRTVRFPPFVHVVHEHAGPLRANLLVITTAVTSNTATQ
jgi:hypothetical protein